jgi:signal transduction histidine kinase
MATVMDRGVETQADRATLDHAAVGMGLPALAAVAVLALTGWALTMSSDRTQGVVVRAGLIVVWVAAAMMLARRARGPMCWQVLGFAAAASVWAWGAAVEPGDGLASVARFARPIGLAMLPAAAMHILVGMPDGWLGTKGRRVVVIVGYAVALAAGLVMYAQDDPTKTWPMLATLPLVVLVGSVTSTSRYRKARGLTRQRMQWFGWSITVAVTVLVLAGATRLLVHWPENLIATAAVATFPIPIALALSSSTRFVSRIDRLLAGTVAVGGLSGVVVLTYLLIVLGLGRAPEQGERTLLLLSMIAAVIAALLYIPTRDRLITLANKIVYGERHAPDEVLRTFGSRMSRAIPMDELLLQMAESLRKTFGLDMVEVWTGTEGQLKRTVSEPDRGVLALNVGPKERAVVSRAGVSGNAWIKIWLPGLLNGREGSLLRVAPIAHQGDLLGLITLERRNPDEPFTEENDRVLTELARQVGLALHNAQLDNALQATLDEVRRQAEDLAASRQRIVASADAARRKLERDLHDGAQQHLVALKVKLGLVRQLQEADPANAGMMLGQMQSDIDEAVQALRDLSHGIYPKVLADRGLVPALESIAMKAALPTSIEPEGDINRHDEEVEAAIYFCCLEALQNAGKHAGEGSFATIKVRESEGALEFEVRDTGKGFDMSVKGTGAGFVNMADRVGAIGGTIKVQSAPGEGTAIVGRVPVRA